MKLNYRIYKYLANEPFLTQEINGKQVGFYFMNDTPFLQSFVSKGRFYVWTSDGKGYKLLIERGYYEKVKYFFAADINEIWLNFLDDITIVNSKMSRKYLAISLGISLSIVVIFSLLLAQYLTWGIIGALILTLVGNTMHSNKVNTVVREKNLKAQEDIKNILTENKFDQFLKDQEDYMKEYFKFDEEEFEDEDLEEINDEEVLEEVEVVEDETKEGEE